jgi:hypothetical protein
MDWRDVPDPGMFDWRGGVAARIASWNPGSLPPPVWERIGPAVRETVARSHPVSAVMASGLLGALSAVAVFALERGMGADPGVWLDPATLDLFARAGRPDLAAATRAGYVSRVRALCDPLPLADRDVFAPYRPGQMAALWAGAGAQSTAARCRDARVLIALGAGAGLTAWEIAQVRAHDVRPAGAAVVVSVRGPRQRMVVVRRSFEHTLAQVAHAYTGQVVYLLAPGRYYRQSVAAALTASWQFPHTCPPLVTRRLRATWLCELADAQLPLPVLAAAAGITELGRVTRLLRHLRRPDTDPAADLLRDA